MNGCLYGVSVGPGDPDLVTIKAIKTINSSDVVAYPVRTSGERSVALGIVEGAMDISNKTTMEVLFRMSTDVAERRRDYERARDALVSILSSGRSVAMIVLGDISVYSTYMRIGEDIATMGFDTEIVPGVTSFLCGAAKSKVPLVIGSEDLLIAPLVGQGRSIDEMLDAHSNIVFMKAFDHMGEIHEKAKERGIDPKDVIVFSNLGMDDEYVGELDLSRKYGYFTTVMVKNRRKKR